MSHQLASESEDDSSAFGRRLSPGSPAKRPGRGSKRENTLLRSVREIMGRMVKGFRLVRWRVKCEADKGEFTLPGETRRSHAMLGDAGMVRYVCIALQRRKEV